MALRQFEQPIFVKLDRDVREITALDDAVEFLTTWPAAERDLVFETVERACRDALSDQFPMSSAEETFRRFARKKGILYCPTDVPNR
ncbi:DUF982 domain-containing protein [Rhizobium sp. BK251]|uniref:DUF982 domain-containing protein n=1 Tax=Rhizobium sp. BK251 TaxID=2512125 RepID=UPI00104C9833|nr:DUF982 domain-containing protein [Rhizobium sp. BK251]TCL67178.1 uncharacterized protein DUF982 [Rhizobium sp. BK251]